MSRNQGQHRANPHSDISKQGTVSSGRLENSPLKNGSEPPLTHRGQKGQHKPLNTPKQANSLPQNNWHRLRKASNAKGDSSTQPSTSSNSHASPIASFDEEELSAQPEELALTAAVTWPVHFARFPILAQPNIKRKPWSFKKWTPLTVEPSSPASFLDSKQLKPSPTKYPVASFKRSTNDPNFTKSKEPKRTLSTSR